MCVLRNQLPKLLLQQSYTWVRDQKQEQEMYSGSGAIAFGLGASRSLDHLLCELVIEVVPLPLKNAVSLEELTELHAGRV